MSSPSHQLVLFSKPGCHLCEGLEEKLATIQQIDPCPLPFTVEIRDITTRPEWFAAYQYEIPVLCWAIASSQGEQLTPIPRQSPRTSVERILKVLQQTVPN
ncbi:MAG: glutaredoxin family protein [Leptolyngbyaceae bacterium]|nr:glutaredoxin family protein [Leptolyngbyaceae bacterium]